jgi:hypothetical protein
LALSCGGPDEQREVLRRMAWQVTELGLHRLPTARAYPASERVDRLFFMTLYKDSWFAALCGRAPFIRYGDFDPGVLVRANVEDSAVVPLHLFGSRDLHTSGLEALPFLLQLTMFENELATIMSRPVVVGHEDGADGGGAAGEGRPLQFGVDAVLELEQRWGEWMVAMRDDQVLNERPLFHAYATIRFNW